MLTFAGLSSGVRKIGIYIFFVSLFLIWFMGFRYYTGCDYTGYLNRWNNYALPNDLSNVFKGEEIGFSLLVYSVKSINLDYTWLNVFASVILVFCYSIFAKAHRWSGIILALLFPVVIVQLGMSGIRQALAGAFLMLAFNAFISEKKIRTAMLILVGMQFHTSVVMFLPIALLAGEKVDTIRLAVAVAVIGPAASLLLADRFDTYADRYIDQIYGSVSSGGAIIRYALIALPVPFFLYYHRRIRIDFPRVYPFLKLIALIILSLSPLIILSSIALHRINYYVMPGSILLCVYVGAVLARRTQTGHLLFLASYGIYSLLWFLSSRHAQLCYVPYENTWTL
ncbi:EpsG family protein [Henriciella barbarensis]|nr:EpsG family protein [Henriciella barbarensis]